MKKTIRGSLLIAAAAAALSLTACSSNDEVANEAPASASQTSATETSASETSTPTSTAASSSEEAPEDVDPSAPSLDKEELTQRVTDYVTKQMGDAPSAAACKGGLPLKVDATQECAIEMAAAPGQWFELTIAVTEVSPDGTDGNLNIKTGGVPGAKPSYAN